MAALFDMQIAGGDCIWRLGNGMKWCNSQSWFAPLIEWLMQRLFTHTASVFPCVCVCISVRLCAPVLIVPWVYVHMYVCLCVYLCVCLCVCIYQLATARVSHLPAPAPWLLICSPSCLSHFPSLHPSHWGFHAPNREIHPHSQLCLQSEPSQS